GTWDVRNEQGQPERVRPQDIRNTGLLTVEGELDDISGCGQTHAAHGLCTGIEDPEQRHYEVPGAGHYGIFSGRRWREQVYPIVRAFILEHEPQSAAAIEAAHKGAAELDDGDSDEALPRKLATTTITDSAAASRRASRKPAAGE
ncbi:MAG: polyhydroxyalkanoate depolymerase, partial [Serpentinimonas sp.]|nr:polyhydroxyalkanoate depolymerase [Serpentinimonas sp.]